MLTVLFYLCCMHRCQQPWVLFSVTERAGQACFSFSIVQTSFSHAARALWTALGLAWEPCGHVYWPGAGVQDGCQRKQTNQNNKGRRIKRVVSLSRSQSRDCSRVNEGSHGYKVLGPWVFFMWANNSSQCQDSLKHIGTRTLTRLSVLL